MPKKNKVADQEKEFNFLWIVIPLFIAFLLFITWNAIRPGVFTIMPNDMYPEGMTIVYYSKDRSMPFFISPDSMCLEAQGYVTTNCRMSAMLASLRIAERILFRLPYSHWAYLQSTGGLDFFPK